MTIKPKWDYQESYTSFQILLDEIDYWFWKHGHWLWWQKKSLLQWLRERKQILKHHKIIP